MDKIRIKELDGNYLVDNEKIQLNIQILESEFNKFKDNRNS